MLQKPKLKKWLTGAGVAVFWILVWQGLSMLVGKPILFAAPLDTLKALFTQITEKSFLLTVWSSFYKIVLGFLLAFAAGLLAGTAAWRFPLVGTLLSPLLSFAKSVPVASFIILAIVWFGSGALSVVISFLIVFPMLYFATLNGLKSTDPQLKEMAEVFRVPGPRRALSLYRPAMTPYVINACSSALGMSWKAGIAAEVIGTPANSIGEKLYGAKLYMQTPELFAWTIVVILLSFLFEKLFLHLLRKAGGAHGA